MFSNIGVRWIGLGWAAFITENLVLSHNREEIISAFGNDKYHLAYNILSTAACSSIGYGLYRHGKVGGAVFSRRGIGGQLVGVTLHALGLTGLSQLAPALQIPIGITDQSTSVKVEHLPGGTDDTKQQSSAGSLKSTFYVRCPMDFRRKGENGGITGMERVTRHPALWSLGIASLGTAVTTGWSVLFLLDVECRSFLMYFCVVYYPYRVMFTFPIVFSFIGSTHQDYRFRRHNGGSLSPEQEAVTSNIPFLAFLEGRQQMAVLRDEIKWTNAGIAVLTAILLGLRRYRV